LRYDIYFPLGEKIKLKKLHIIPGKIVEIGH